jgi:predicted nucleotidyltransferase component of viral defense system
MLYYNAIYPGTLELLKKMMNINSLKDFYLVGGTSLALQMGHRISIDLDLFTSNSFNTDIVLQEIKQSLKVVEFSESKNTLNLVIEYPEKTGQQIKVDILTFAYPLVKKTNDIDSIRLLSIEDIIPMKLSAIASRGVKRDFYDLHFLLEKFTLPEMMSFFSIRFPDTNQYHIIKSLTWFEDAEKDMDPILIKKVTWKQVKNRIELVVKNSF